MSVTEISPFSPPPSQGVRPPPLPSGLGPPGLTVFVRAMGLLAVEGMSTGLFAWGVRASWRLAPYATSNDITPRGRLLLLANMFGAAAVAVLVALAAMVWRRRAGLNAVDNLARRLAPLVVVGLLPFLMNWSIWSGRDVTFLVAASLVGLGLQPLMMMSLSASPIFGGRAWLRRLAQPWHRFRAGHPRLFARLPLGLVVAGILIYMVFFSYVTIVNHRNIQTTSLDLGLEDNLIWNALHGGPLFKSSPYTGPTGTHGGNHVTFFAYVIAAVYLVAQRAETLLVVQALLLGGAAFPLFLFARRHLGPWMACLVALCYLLYPPLHGSNLYDFHYLPLGPFFLWLTLYALEARRNVLSVIAVILTLSVREDVAAGLGIIGIYLLLTGQRPKVGLLVAAVGTAYFVALKMVIMPRLISGASFLWMYTGLVPSGDNSFGGVLKTVIGNPTYTLNGLLERDKFVYVLQLLAPLAFVPLRRPIGWLCCLPGFMFTLLSTGYTPLYQISFQYTAHWTSYLFVALVSNLDWVAKHGSRNGGLGRDRQRAWMVSLVVASLILSHQYGALMQQNTVRGGFGPYRFGTTATDRARHDALYALIAMVPPRAKIAGTETVVPHISHRPDAYTMRMGVFDAEYLLFILPAGGEEGRHVSAALTSGGYGVVAVKEPYALAKKGHPAELNPSVLPRISTY